MNERSQVIDLFRVIKNCQNFVCVDVIPLQKDKFIKIQPEC